MAGWLLAISILLFSPVCTLADDRNRTIVGSKLLLLVVDGLPWTIDEDRMPNLGRMRADGANADYLKPVYPSVGYPNYFSMLTGLHPEEHGIVDENMFDDRESKSFFVKGNTHSGTNSTEVRWFQKGELFWTTVQNQDRKIAVYGWTSCNHTDGAVGPKPDTCIGEVKEETDLKRSYEFVDQALDHLGTGTADVAIVFVNKLDYVGRVPGIRSKEFNETLTSVDGLIGHIRDRMDNASLADSTNMILISTHGLSSTVRPPLVVDISRFSEDVKKAVTFFPGGSHVAVYPEQGALARTFNNLYLRHKHVRVYWKWNMPRKWRIRSGRYTAPIWVVADPGWAVAASKKEALYLAATRGGLDGYDPDESFDMRGVFVGVGPAFKQNYTHHPVNMTDVYELLCRIVGVRSSANSGQLSEVIDLLETEPHAKPHLATTTRHPPTTAAPSNWTSLENETTSGGASANETSEMISDGGAGVNDTQELIDMMIAGNRTNVTDGGEDTAHGVNGTHWNETSGGPPTVIEEMMTTVGSGEESTTVHPNATITTITQEPLTNSTIEMHEASNQTESNGANSTVPTVTEDPRGNRTSLGNLTEGFNGNETGSVNITEVITTESPSSSTSSTTTATPPENATTTIEVSSNATSSPDVIDSNSTSTELPTNSTRLPDSGNSTESLVQPANVTESSENSTTTDVTLVANSTESSANTTEPGAATNVTEPLANATESSTVTADVTEAPDNVTEPAANALNSTVEIPIESNTTSNSSITESPELQNTTAVDSTVSTDLLNSTQTALQNTTLDSTTPSDVHNTTLVDSTDLVNNSTLTANETTTQSDGNVNVTTPSTSLNSTEPSTNSTEIEISTTTESLINTTEPSASNATDSTISTSETAVSNSTDSTTNEPSASNSTDSVISTTEASVSNSTTDATNSTIVDTGEPSAANKTEETAETTSGEPSSVANSTVDPIANSTGDPIVNSTTTNADGAEPTGTNSSSSAQRRLRRSIDDVRITDSITDDRGNESEISHGNRSRSAAIPKTDETICECDGKLCTMKSNLCEPKESRKEIVDVASTPSSPQSPREDTTVDDAKEKTNRHLQSTQGISVGTDEDKLNDSMIAEVQVYDWRSVLANFTRTNRGPRKVPIENTTDQTDDEESGSGIDGSFPFDSPPPVQTANHNRSDLSVRFNHKAANAQHSTNTNSANVRSQRYDLGTNAFMVQNRYNRPSNFAAFPPAAADRFLDMLRSAESASSDAPFHLNQFNVANGGQASQYILQQPVLNFLLPREKPQETERVESPQQGSAPTYKTYDGEYGKAKIEILNYDNENNDLI